MTNRKYRGPETYKYGRHISPTLNNGGTLQTVEVPQCAMLEIQKSKTGPHATPIKGTQIKNKKHGTVSKTGTVTNAFQTTTHQTQQ